MFLSHRSVDDAADLDIFDATGVHKQTVDDLKIPIKGYGTFQVSVAFKQGYEPPQTIPIVDVDLTTTTGELFTVEALVRSEPLCAKLEEVTFDPQEKFKHLKMAK